MKEDIEINNLIDQLSKKSSYPSLEFEYGLRQKVLEANKHEYQGFWNKLFFGIGKIKLNGLGNMLGAFITMVVMLGSIFYLANNNYTVHEQVRVLKGNEQYNLLTQVYANNPQALINYNKPLLTSNLDESILSMAVTDLVTKTDAQSEKNFNYFHLSTATSYGPFAVNCIELQEQQSKADIYTYESDNTDYLFFKMVEYNTDNSIIDYILVNDDNYFRYYGAATTNLIKLGNTDNILLDPVDLTATPSPTPDDAEVEEVVSGDKVLYRVIKRIPNNFCYFNDEDATNKQVTNPGNIVVVLLIDPAQNFAVTETQYYYEFATLANQIMITTSNQDRQYLAPQEASGLFQYDLPYPVEMELINLDLPQQVKGILIKNQRSKQD
jgi:hypothetical protein